MKIHLLTQIQGNLLMVFYSPGGCWQFRVISPNGDVLGEKSSK